MKKNARKDKIIIIDFGSQVTKLIARRIREFKVYSEIYTIKEISKINNFSEIKGIILSGGPSTVTKSNFPKIPKYIFDLNIPILGICYGLQLIAKYFGGKVQPNIKKREFGRAQLFIKKKSLLTQNYYKKNFTNVWMSHQDSVFKLPKGFTKIASTKHSSNTIIENTQKRVYGIQFHPEVTHTDNGKILFKNFLFRICKARKNWKLENEKLNDKILKKIILSF